MPKAKIYSFKKRRPCSYTTLEDINAYLEKGKYNVAYQKFQESRQYYESSIEKDIVETKMYLAMGDYAQAVFCAFRGEMKEPHNYEIYLLLAKGFLGKNERKCVPYYCQYAVQYSKGSSDEERIQKACAKLLEQIEET